MSWTRAVPAPGCERHGLLDPSVTGPEADVDHWMEPLGVAMAQAGYLRHLILQDIYKSQDLVE